jgi:hypothetical protein
VIQLIAALQLLVRFCYLSAADQQWQQSEEISADDDTTTVRKMLR